MAHKVLARKWRPQTFQEVIGQEHITRSLQQAILNNRLGQAYLLTGTRGIGKTSVARIFAKTLRCKNRQQDGNSCGQCQGCQEAELASSMNVLEIDGASNNSVDDIRDLINKIQGLPTFGTYKIYIIDEVHMLSTNAFNALLKTLEEPPEHIIFLLATTEPHKLPSTVLSRCQRFDFRNASLETLVKHLENIIQKEQIQFASRDLLETICIQGAGSFRDTLSLLDQVLCFSAGRAIDENMVSQALGLAKKTSLKKLVEGIFNGKTTIVSEIYHNLLYQNVDLENICRGLLDYLYETITQLDGFGTALSTEEAFWVYETLAQDFEWALKSLSPEKTVEIILHKTTLRRTFFSTKKETTKKQTISPHVTSTAPSLKTPLVGESKSWDGFIGHLHKISPVTANNLEQGNIIEEIHFDSEKVIAKIGFRPSAKVFHDYLQGEEVKAKLKEYLSNYLNKDTSAIDLRFVLFNRPEAEKEKFKTRMEIKIEREKTLKKEQEEKILGNLMLKQAEEMFHSKVDRVKLNNH